MKLIACYGSLKKGYYNHGWLGEGAEFKGIYSVRGVMYSNGAYPKLYKIDPESLKETNLRERDYVVEVYEISEPKFNGIEMMELGAGYVTEHIETPYGLAAIWYMPHERFSSHDKWVESY